MHFLSCGYPKSPQGRREDITQETHDLFGKPREGGAQGHITNSEPTIDDASTLKKKVDNPIAVWYLSGLKEMIMGRLTFSGWWCKGNRGAVWPIRVC